MVVAESFVNNHRAAASQSSHTLPGSARLAEEKRQRLPLVLSAGHHGHGTLAGIVRGQRDLAAFAAKLTQFQLRALGSYRKRSGGWDAAKETTFQRLLAN